MPIEPGTRIGSYEVSGPLGKGGMGEVYQARDAKLGRDVAVKVLPEAFANQPERLARFQREAKVLAALNHPNIATVYALEEFEGGKALVMELVEGAPVQGPLPVEQAVKVAIQIADALEAAHDKGITHRDIKPGNILMTPQGVVKVLDFGLAAVPQDAPSSSGPDGATAITLTFSPTQAGMILGTAGYMSPEQAAGQPVDRHADIWAFGVVLYELLTGKRLFNGDSVAHVLADVLRAPIDLTPIPAGPIRDLLARCLERDLRKRLHAIGEARVALENAGSAAASTRRDSSSAPGWTRPAFFLAATLAVAFGVVTFLHYREKPAERAVLRASIGLPENASGVHSFAISPDGKSVVMAARVGGKWQLYLRRMDALQGQLMPLTDNATYPFWSPDSRNIAFFAEGKLKRVSVTGGPAEVLCDAQNGWGGTWGRNDVIVFAQALELPLRKIPAAGGKPVDVLKDRSRQVFPVFLPDGDRFLYWGGVQQYGIYLASLDGRENRPILADSSPPALAIDSSGTLAHLLFLRQNTLMAQPFDLKAGSLEGEAVPVADGIVRDPDVGLPVTVSPSGTLVYWSDVSGNERELTWFDRNGTRLGAVGARGEVVAPSISPDQKAVAYARRGETGSDLWLHDLVRDTETRLTSDGSSNTMPVWSPHGDRIAFGSNRGSGTLNFFEKSPGGTTQEVEVFRNENE